MYQPIIDVLPFDDFETASRHILAYLHRRLGFDLWMMTRTDNEDWIVLQTEDHGYNVEEGSVLRWTDSFCSQMVQGNGPRSAPVAHNVAVYANAPIAQQLQIGAYIGVPVIRNDGSLFGTLCAIDPAPQSEVISQDLPLIELFSRLLGTIISSELRALNQLRSARLPLTRDMIDETTGLYNRKAWDHTTAEEELIAKRFGSPVCVIIVEADIYSLPNTMTVEIALRHVALTLKNSAPASHTIARIGEDTFALLLTECTDDFGCMTADQILQSLNRQGIKAKAGKAMRHPETGIGQALFNAVKDKD